MTVAERRTNISELRSAVEEIDEELEGAMAELRELRDRIEGLRADRAWRKSAIRFLRAGGK